MIKIYHNPRCSKSRQGLEYLEKTGENFEVVRYLENVPTKEELEDIISYLGIAPEELIRKNEAVWKEKYKGKTLSHEDIVNAMIENPKLIERPIIIKGKKAVIGRPAENIDALL
ncbi:arsenate reductase (glutaredoxin) [Flagellimonas sp. S3867]|uniref:arsenate reductase (glutaredoxin) n=1 Tax=Flagellimonas sp. S3867 TaxID=2768063 RepID=UPI001683A6EE|nr:arsenate reductase (glutaredoxin) [Flagellimonas sp. S3867]